MTAKIAFFGLVVKEMPRSLAFYRELGLDIPPAADEQPHVGIELPGVLQLAWDTEDTIRSFDPQWSPPDGGHRVAIAFACGDPSGVDSMYAKLGGLGYRQYKEPWDAFWGQRYAIVLDPDGNHIELCAQL
jgi:catechol 2,3-dioxygenase-like lactoylglutathione lyase family enzyme